VSTINLPHILYFKHDHSTTVPCTEEIAKVFKANYTPISSITELFRSIETSNESTNIVFHIGILEKENITLEKFVSMLRVASDYANTTVNIAAIITKKTTFEMTQRLKNNHVSISLDVADWPIEVASQGVEFVKGTILYPEEILHRDLPKKPLSIYFREDWKTHVTPAMLDNINHSSFDVAYCTNWYQLDQALEQQPHQLIFHIDMLERLAVTIPEIMSMIHIRLRMANLDIPVAVSIDPTVSQTTIKELRRAGVFGLTFSSTHWGPDETINGINALLDRVPYWPKHILDQLPTDTPKKPKPKKSGEITLSPRQTEVLELIKSRGLGNKQIARTLGISESTVKMHVGDIMTAYGVRSRVQLAVLSQ